MRCVHSFPTPSPFYNTIVETFTQISGRREKSNEIVENYDFGSGINVILYTFVIIIH